jgi:hypothetical protein
MRPEQHWVKIMFPMHYRVSMASVRNSLLRVVRDECEVGSVCLRYQFEKVI